MWQPKSVSKSFSSQQSTKLMQKFFKKFLHMKIFLILNDRKGQIPCVKALKYWVACNLVSLETKHNTILFLFAWTVIIWLLGLVTHVQLYLTKVISGKKSLVYLCFVMTRGTYFMLKTGWNSEYLCKRSC